MDPLDLPALRVQGVLERGMAPAQQIGAVNLKAQLVEAHEQLRRALTRSRRMRARMNRMILPEDMNGDEGLAWLQRETAEVALEAIHAGDVAGALSAVELLAGPGARHEAARREPACGDRASNGCR